MNAPAVALAWEFWGRHRIGMAGVFVLVAGFAIRSAVSPLSVNFAQVHSMWLVIGLSYVAGVFAYGFEARLEAPESGFPNRLFMLPVRTWVLVGLPMFQGAATAVVLWLVWKQLVLRPSGIEVPAWWAAMLAAVVVTSQAIVWFPFGLPWVRILVAIFALVALLQAPRILLMFGDRFMDPDSEATALTLFAAALAPAAYLLAVAGVSHARCGGSSDWLRAWRVTSSAAVPVRELAPFASAIRSQMWYEWRARGRTFVTITGSVLAILMLAALLSEPNNSGRTKFAQVFPLIPLIIASLYSSYAGVTGTEVRSAQLSAFAATRPLSNSAFVVAKFLSAGVITLAALGLTLVVTVAWFTYTGGFHDVGVAWESLAARFGQTKVVAGGTLLAISCALLTWRTLAVNLWPGLSGRTWIAATYPILTVLFGLEFISEWIMWNTELARREQILELLPWLAGGAVVLKAAIGCWATWLLVRRDELTAATAGKVAAVWLLLATALFGLLVWLVPEGWIPVYGLALGAVLIVPYTRLAVAPLALAWNRHR